jgi:DNA-binding transcriptional MerR regulator
VAPTLTVNQLASRICSDPKKLPVLVERIRHWTRSGLLQPIEGRPGRGTSRLFQFSDLPAAAVLNALSETAGFIGREILHALALLPDAADGWTKDQKQRWWLELPWASGGGTKSPAKLTAKIHEGALNPTPTARVAIILDLNLIFAAVKWADDGAADNKGTPPTARRRKK